MDWLSVFLGALIALISWTAVSLFINYQAASQIGLPIIISPISPLNPLWILACRFTPLIKWLRSVSWIVGRFPRCSYIGWTFNDKYALHNELGDALILVSPGINEIYLADPGAVANVLGRRKEFIKPMVLYEQMNVFGPTVNTVEGETWQRHRKITVPSFNERTSDSVWKETLRQGQSMLQSWVSKEDLGNSDTVQDTAILALHVLTSAGFGMSYPFSRGVQESLPGYLMSYRDALLLILQNIILLAIFPRKLLSSSLLPRKLRDLEQATIEFKRHMEEMLARERRSISLGESSAGNLLSALVRASDEANQSDTKGRAIQGLTDDEIFGNIFMYNLAGHETTANTVAYAIMLLAAYPEWQDWLAEEIDNVLGHEKDLPAWDYETAFPKLKRCLATMFEVLRLYGSIVFIPKSTGLHPQLLNIRGKYYHIPSNTFVYTNVQALHTDPRAWSPDPLTWRPDRWLVASKGRDGPMSSETIIEPENGTFVPWADGPRSCPGRKFAQVEFVAVMATLFREHRVRPVKLAGESAKDAQRKVLAVVDDSAISAITLQMQQPERVSLVWSKK